MYSKNTRETAHQLGRLREDSAARQSGAPFSNDVFEFVVSSLDASHERVENAVALLSDEEIERANRFVFDRDRARFVVARAELRKLLAAKLGMRPEQVEFVYGRYGKPQLAQGCSRGDLCFNMSHSEEVAVYAFSYGREIGVDVEAIRVIPDSDEIAAKCFSIRENEEFFGLEACDRAEGFFNCWTRKEAFVKAIGDGLYHPLDNFDVTLTPSEAAEILRVGNTTGENCGWELYEICPLPGYVGAVVVESRI